MTQENVHGYIEALASSASSPGGGSATALVGALSAALSLMVTNVFAKRSQTQVSPEELVNIRETGTSLVQTLEEAMATDATAFDGVLEAYKLPKETPEEKKIRAQHIEAGLVEATNSPLNAMKTTRKVLDMLDDVTSLQINGTIVNDLIVGAIFAKAALEAGYVNVLVNTKMMKDKTTQEAMNEEAHHLKHEGMKQADRIVQTVSSYLELGAWT